MAHSEAESADVSPEQPTEVSSKSLLRRLRSAQLPAASWTTSAEGDAGEVTRRVYDA